MNDDERKKLGKQILDTACSLTDSIMDAGGYARLSELRDMTVEELMVQIMASNDLRFTWKKQ